MQYLSPEFGLCFLIFLWLYWGIAGRFGNRGQNLLLLLASYSFYGGIDLRFLLLLLVFSGVILGLSRLVKNPSGGLRRWPVTLGVVYALINLGAFKYYNFFRESADAWLGGFFQVGSLPILDILLPVGISFYTFQGLAYLITIGRGERPAAAWLDGLLHLSFFPTLLSGPICRPAELLTQIEATDARKIEQGELAMLLVVSALIKKVWLAAWLANTWVNPIFANPSAYHPVELCGGLAAYAWQLFFDFSGYTDLVTALALLLGFSLPANFRQPYLAENLGDFWRRWHMTLSRWIRDFIYIPLGGSRGGWWRTQANVVIAMTLSGIWHGASLTFVAWGLWHGLGMVLQNIWQKMMGTGLPGFFSKPITFVFVCFGWLLFRAEDWDALQTFVDALGNWQTPPQLNSLGLVLALVGFFTLSHYAPRLLEQARAELKRLPWPLQSGCVVAACLAVIAVAPAGIPGFIYFGF